MLKIVVTISNFVAAANIGGEVERHSEIINIPESAIPVGLKTHMKNKEISKWQTVSLSILDEEI